MTQINIKFTYNLADDYLSQTNLLGKTAEWTYIGPDKIWIFVDTETNRIGNYNHLTEEEDGAIYPCPEGHFRVEVDCVNNPLLATLLNANSYTVDQNDLPQIEINLPDGNVYSRPRDPDPNHTYESSEIVYNDGDWTIPWKKSWVTWEDIYKASSQYISLAEKDLEITSLPESIKTKLTDYITALKNLETDWADFEPYMYILPDYPL